MQCRPLHLQIWRDSAHLDLISMYDCVLSRMGGNLVTGFQLDDYD